MPFSSLAMLLLTPQADPEIAQLSDEQFCEVVRYAVNQSGPPGKPGRPVLRQSISVDCSEKKVTVEFQLSTMDIHFRRWVRAYMLEIEPKACSESDAVMTAFRSRGWEQHYSFRSRDRRTIDHMVEC